MTHQHLLFVSIMWSWLQRLLRGKPVDIVTGTDLVVQEVGRWSPGDVAFIRRVGFENCDGASFDLALMLLLQPRPHSSAGWPDPAGKYWEVDIVFKQVKDLSVTICGPWDIQTPGFAIEDIRDRQWEAIKLLVYDYENLTREGLSFGARSAEIRSCQSTVAPPRSDGLWREYPGVFGSASLPSV